MASRELIPGQVIFIQANGETAAPGWYRVQKFDHEHTREFGEDGEWYWECIRLVDGLLQTISERDPHMLVDCERAPDRKDVLR